jgi:hypothetical protein
MRQWDRFVRRRLLKKRLGAMLASLACADSKSLAVAIIAVTLASVSALT